MLSFCARQLHFKLLLLLSFCLLFVPACHGFLSSSPSFLPLLQIELDSLLALAPLLVSSPLVCYLLFSLLVKLLPAVSPKLLLHVVT